MFSKLSAEAVIKHLALKPLPGEGGFYRETYATATEGRPIGTAILYLVTAEEFSQWHRLDCDEIYHYYYGDNLAMGFIDSDCRLTSLRLGPETGRFQHAIPKGTWQGSKTIGGQFGYTLIGATCHPGYQKQGFELPTPSDLRKWMAQNPAEKDFIHSLQRGIL